MVNGTTPKSPIHIFAFHPFRFSGIDVSMYLIILQYSGVDDGQIQSIQPDPHSLLTASTGENA